MNYGESVHFGCHAVSKPTWYRFGDSHRSKGDITMDVSFFLDYNEKLPTWVYKNNQLYGVCLSNLSVTYLLLYYSYSTQ